MKILSGLQSTKACPDFCFKEKYNQKNKAKQTETRIREQRNLIFDQSLDLAWRISLNLWTAILSTLTLQLINPKDPKRKRYHSTKLFSILFICHGFLSSTPKK